METPLKKAYGSKGQILHGQVREMIFNVIQFMKQEAVNGAPLIPLASFRERVIAATKISESTYKRIVKESKVREPCECPTFSTPNKKRQKTAPKSTLFPGEKETIRRVIHEFYITEKIRPTIKRIYTKISQSGVDFTGGLTTFRKVIKRMGFRWQKTSDKRKILMESHDIRYKRIVYLNQLVKFKAEGRSIVYTDESYLHSSHTVPREWSDNSTKGLKKPLPKGRRLIMVHAGNQNGFIPNALLMFTSGAKTGDYHHDMNYENFTKWVATQLIPNLPEKSVLVIDNASYHNVLTEKHPTSSSLKRTMIEWLVHRNIMHDPLQTKAQLYEIINMYKPKQAMYALDTLLHKHGHSVLRLPPYHPELNPIEKIWAIVKNWVAARNTTFKLNDVKQLALEKFNSITAAEWASVCAHVDKTADSYLATERILDEAIDHLCFTVNTGDSDDGDEELERDYCNISGIDSFDDSESD